MRIVIITQNEPFLLKDNLEYLFNILPKKFLVVGCIVSDVSPFGKKESFFQKAFKTLNIFGLKFFIFYSIKFIFSKIMKESVKSLLRRKKIKEITLNNSINSNTSLNKIKTLNPDLLVSILGNQIFKKPLLNIAKFGCINLHTALLPKYRGLMPTFWVMKNKESFTGVSVFFVDEGIDSGEIIIQRKVLIGDKTQLQLIKLTKRIGMELICEAIKKIEKGDLKLIPNPDNQKTYFSFPKQTDVKEFLKQGNKFF